VAWIGPALLPGLSIAAYSSGVACHDDAGRHITGNNGSGANDGTLSYADAGYHDGARTDHDVAIDRHAAA
jgi:hypothetical protein